MNLVPGPARLSDSRQRLGGYGRHTVLTDDAADSAVPRFAPDIDPQKVASWRAWGSANRELLVAVFEHFRDEREWPDISHLQRQLDRQDLDVDVAQRMWEIPRELGFRDGSRAVLTPQGLRFVDQAAGLLHGYFSALRLAYQRYRGPDPNPTLGARDLRAVGATPRETSLVTRLLMRFGPGLGGGPGSEDDEWERDIDEQIRIVRDAESAEQMLDRIAARRWPATRGLVPEPVQDPSADVAEPARRNGIADGSTPTSAGRRWAGRRMVDWFRGEERSRFDRIVGATIATLMAAAILGVLALAADTVTSFFADEDGNDGRSQRMPSASGVASARDPDGDRIVDESRRRGRSAAEERLMTFVRARTPGVATSCRATEARIPKGGLASTVCRIEDTEVRFVRFSTSVATKRRFLAARSVLPQFDGAVGPCGGQWTYWTWNDVLAGDFALRQGPVGTRIVWTYRGHRVLAIADAGPTGARRLCRVWEAAGSLP